MPELGVNMDHVATLRQARRTYEPDPIRASLLAELGGAGAITIHLREDRRHIQDRDLHLLRETVHIKLNLEMSCSPEIVAIAVRVRPDQVTLVPERPQEVTTEGGLDVVANREAVIRAIGELKAAGIHISLFLDALPEQIALAAELGADAVELHTRQYSRSRDATQRDELARLIAGGRRVREFGMALHGGHGLNYRNVRPVAEMEDMHELNIGHSIVARSVYVGLERAVREMVDLITIPSARRSQ